VRICHPDIGGNCVNSLKTMIEVLNQFPPVSGWQTAGIIEVSIKIVQENSKNEKYHHPNLFAFY
jgi:hypothetical protein